MDKRNTFAEENFSYRVHKDGAVFIFYAGRQVVVVKDKRAEALLRRIEHADADVVQLELAKTTGNFKRGNERA